MNTHALLVHTLVIHSMQLLFQSWNPDGMSLMSDLSAHMADCTCSVPHHQAAVLRQRQCHVQVPPALDSVDQVWVMVLAQVLGAESLLVWVSVL